MPVLDGNVGREHTAKDGVVQPAVHIDQVKPVIMLMQGIASVEGMGYVVIPEADRVAAAAPGIVAQPLHGAAMDGGREVALVVFQGVVHGTNSLYLRRFLISLKLLFSESIITLTDKMFPVLFSILYTVESCE